MEPAIYPPLHKWYTAQADSFLLQLLVLQKIQGYKYKPSVFEKQFIKVRHAFKKMEPLISYFDAIIYLGINSRVKEEIELSKGTYEYVAQPHGLQVMESFLADDSTFKASSKAVDNEINLAISTARFLKTYHFNKPCTDTGFFNAIKAATIRIAALGITGFDKPILKNAIGETATVLTGLQELVLLYQNVYPGIVNLTKLSLQITLAKQFISNTTNNFDDFNRLTFIRKYLQPVFALADKIGKQDVLKKMDAPLYSSFFQKGYIDQLYHQTKTYPAEMVALGKSLFESNSLSANEQISCATCHNPELNFADTVQRNTGFSFVDTAARNTPTLFNTTYHIRFQRDGHVLFIQDQFKEVLSSRVEMGSLNEKRLMEKIRANDVLQQEFKAVFGVSKDNITYQLTLDALEAFVRSLTSLHSPFDQYMTYETKLISPSVKRGFNLFMGEGKCGTCHFMPVFNGVMPPYANKEDNEVIGVLEMDDFDEPVLSKDMGLFTHTKLDLHRNSFKVPTVRNLKKTAPYMHNGSLKNLNDLLIFYNVGGGGGLGFGLHVPNQSLNREPIRLNEDERKDLEAFLLSLD